MSLVRLGPCVGVVAGDRRQGALADPRSVSLGASSSRNVNTAAAHRGETRFPPLHTPLFIIGVSFKHIPVGR